MHAVKPKFLSSDAALIFKELRQNKNSIKSFYFRDVSTDEAAIIKGNLFRSFFA
jgi:hypothetical protein